MANNSASGKRIAKNSLILYVRMLFSMLVSLYTSRVILEVLGVQDYGMYNVVGGVVTLFGFITGSLSATSSRYITVALGHKNPKELCSIFGTILTVQYLLAMFIFLFCETAGLWLVSYKLVIPDHRIVAVQWIYQCSIITTIVSILNVPYNALIIAYEKMKVYAYVSMFSVIVKLGGILLLKVIKGDTLICLGVIMLIIEIMSATMGILYCRRRFVEIRMLPEWNMKLLKKVFSYSGWTSFGYLAIVGLTQGVNILLNLFYGPAVNAARGISVQVQNAVRQMCANFQIAINPQITKSYASGDFGYMHQLVIISSKYSFFIMTLLIVPIEMNVPYILKLWLGNYPEHTVMFIKLTLVMLLIKAMSNPLLTALHATGDIRKFQIIEGLSMLLTVPVCYIILKSGCKYPEIVFIISLIMEIATQCIRIYMILPRIQFNMKEYIRSVLLPIMWIIAPLSLIYLIYIPNENFMGFATSVLCIVIVAVLLIYNIGLSKEERSFACKWIKSMINFKNF